MRKEPITGTIGIILFCLIVLLGIIFLPYFATPVFDFKESTPFHGNSFYNPYQQTDTAWQQIETKNEQLLIKSPTINYDTISLPLEKYDCKKNLYHHFCIGADRKMFVFFPFGQNIHNEQFKINKLQTTCDFLAIYPDNIPDKELRKLSNYDAIAVSSTRENKLTLWDSVLSSGYYAVLYPDNIDNGGNTILINSHNCAQTNILNALKQGKYISILRGEKTSTDIQTFKYIQINNDTLQIAFDYPMSQIRLIGQNGQTKAQVIDNNFISYCLTDTDTYIRIEALDGNENTLIFNPLVRCEHVFPINSPRFSVNQGLSIAKQITYTLIFLILFCLCLHKVLKKLILKLKNPIYRNLFLIISISLILRVILSISMELNFDELYYCFLAQFPAWSYFDHPPMVTWLINLTTGFLILDSTLFVRLSSLILGIANSLLIFDIGKRISTEKEGLLAAFLYNISPYALLVAGTFILPDTGLVFFSLLSIQQMVPIFMLPNNEKQTHTKHFLLTGLFIGLACLSKYSAAFLWLGIGIYILFYNRKLLKNKYLYISILITFIVCLPILIWNINHDFISFAYQSGRVDNKSIQIDKFFVEILGEALYNNPIVFVFTIILIIQFFKRKTFLTTNKSVYQIFFCIALPFLGLFWTFALFQSILPHWNAPAYILLIFPLAHWLYQKHLQTHAWVRKSLTVAAILIVFIIIIFTLCFYIKTPFIAKQNFIVQLSTSQQEAQLFVDYAKEQEKQGKMPIDAPIVTTRWMTAATYEHYIPLLDGRRIVTISSLDNTHEFAWKSQKRNVLNTGNDYWFITNDNQYFSPENLSPYFHTITTPDTLYINKGNNTTIKEIYIYRLKGLEKIPDYFE